MHAAQDRISTIAHVYALVAASGLTLLVLFYTTGFGAGHERLFNEWLYNGLLVMAVAACALRVLHVPRERAAWLALTIATASETLGEIFYDFVYGGDPPVPSVADALYVGFYPASYVALLLLLRSRISAINPSLWLDGVMASLAAAALGAAVLLQVVLESTEGSFSVVATNLAYPTGDVLLLALVVGVFVLTAWRPERTWVLIGAALVATALADGSYLFQTAMDTYVEGRLWDALWPASMLLLAVAAWVPARHRSRVQLEGRPLIATPAVCGLVGVGILIADHFYRLNTTAVILAGATLLAVLVRTALTFRENTRILERIRRQAVSDSLTGLGNRRALITDLEQALAHGVASTPSLLIIFDLDGFKQYNDTFGHPAGDALLARLGKKLAAVTGGLGDGYRLGGDEFCVLADMRGHRAETIIELAAQALTEQGEGFEIESSYGAVSIPGEATEPAEALRLADSRLYAQKNAAKLGRGQPHEVLLQLLLEREPELHDHVRGVAKLSALIGERVGLTAPELAKLELTAALHDIGKLAIPDTILRKNEGLTEEEWAFVRQHTIIGQRILAAAPALGEVATIVRSSHEYWNGSGYPDGLAGEAIPLEARIIAVADAFTALTSRRPYRDAISQERALPEIQRSAGTQFDPAIVAALQEVLADRSASAQAETPAQMG
jgi:diguanylate cyclase (GGDEF)-like protein